MRTSSSLPSFASCGGKDAVDGGGIVIVIGINIERKTRELDEDAFKGPSGRVSTRQTIPIQADLQLRQTEAESINGSQYSLKRITNFIYKFFYVVSQRSKFGQSGSFPITKV